MAREVCNEEESQSSSRINKRQRRKNTRYEFHKITFGVFRTLFESGKNNDFEAMSATLTLGLF